MNFGTQSLAATPISTTEDAVPAKVSESVEAAVSLDEVVLHIPRQIQIVLPVPPTVKPVTVRYKIKRIVNFVRPGRGRIGRVKVVIK